MTRRGLTLLEIIVAAALLAGVVAALVPWLRTPATPPAPPPRELLELAAEAILADPPAAGLPEDILAWPSRPTEISWPPESLGDAAALGLLDEQTALPPLRLHVEPRPEHPLRHAWLVLQADALVTVRPLRLPAERRPSRTEAKP